MILSTLFLYSYRRTVQSSTGHTPAELMFGCNFKGPLDIVLPTKSKENTVEVVDGSFKEGDAVFARNFGKGNEWVEGTIKQVLGLKNYLIKIDANGNLTWKRHESKIFSRVIYPENWNKNNGKSENNVLRCPSKIATFDINNDVNPNSEQVIEINNDSDNSSLSDDNSSSFNKDKDLVQVRRSDRIIKKPNRLNL